MVSEINNAKCAQWMLDCMEGIDFPNVRDRVYMTEWFSVKDKLPEHERIVLVSQNGKIPKVALFHMGMGDYLFLDVSCMRYQLKGITHWTDLPEPPNYNCFL